MGKLETESLCQKAMIYYYDCLSDTKEGIPDEILAHIEECAKCRQELQWLRQADSETSIPSDRNAVLAAQATHLKLHFALIDHPVTCSAIKTFLPAMAIPGQQITAPTPVTAHISHCSRCAQELAALGQLGLTTAQYGEICRLFSDHSSRPSQSFSDRQIQVIDEMRNRPDSGIITWFRVKDASQTGEENSFDVEVAGIPAASAETPENTPIQTVRSASSEIRRRHPLQPSRLLRPMAAAAAILLFTLLLFKNSSVQATDIGQIYESLKTVKNILITQYGADSSATLQQTWVSKTLGVKLFKTKDQFTLWDLNRGVKQTLAAASPTQSVPLDKASIEAVSETMNTPWDLLPFKNTRELPEGAIWRKLESKQTGTGVEQTEVYDLFWTEQAFGGDVEYQWRFHIDAATKRPLKVQSWKKTQPQTEYEPVIRIEVAYPTAEQIQDMVKQFGL